MGHHVIILLKYQNNPNTRVSKVGRVSRLYVGNGPEYTPFRNRPFRDLRFTIPKITINGHMDLLEDSKKVLKIMG